MTEFEHGWKAATNEIITLFAAMRNNYLMPKNKQEQIRLQTYNKILAELDRFNDTQLAIAAYQDAKDKGFPHMTYIREVLK